MATRQRKPAPRHPDAPTSSVAAAAPWASLLFQPLLDLQRLQWHTALCWHRSVATLGRDLWEQWAVRYGGGLPIDG
jgi:hypothetical protein